MDKKIEILFVLCMSENLPQPKNIFETASHIEKARSRKENSKKEAAKEIGQVEKKREEKGDVAEFLTKGKKLHEEISSKIDVVFTKNKVSPSDYRKYLSRPQNFSAKQWEQLEEQRKKNESLLQNLMQKMGGKAEAGPALKKAQEKPAPKLEEKKPEPPKEEPSEKKPPIKKPKIITRRQWIGM